MMGNLNKTQTTCTVYVFSSALSKIAICQSKQLGHFDITLVYGVDVEISSETRCYFIMNTVLFKGISRWIMIFKIL